jgi:hypothetical protein
LLVLSNRSKQTFRHGDSHSVISHWDIKPFTQRFLNAVANSNCKVLKVHRSFNTTAHLLATQAFRRSELQCNQGSFSCTNVNHVDSCPLHEALQFVTWDPYSLGQLLAANNKSVICQKKNHLTMHAFYYYIQQLRFSHQSLSHLSCTSLTFKVRPYIRCSALFIPNFIGISGKLSSRNF